MPHDVDDDDLLRDAVLGADDIEPPNKRRPTQPRLVVDNAKPKRSRVTEAEGFSRVFWHWFEEPRFRAVFPATARLWMLIWFRSAEGQEPVRLTRRLLADAAIPLRYRHRYAHQLAAAGLIRLVRTGRSGFEATVLTPRPRA
jgi:hypothetical protein